MRHLPALLALFFAALFSLSCAKTESDFPPFEAGRLGTLTTEEKEPAPATDAVQVVSAAPMGEVNIITEALTVSIVFNQPMVVVDDGSQSASEKGIIQFSPAIKGSYRWLGSRTLLFTPKDTLPFATVFTAKVPKETKSLTGKTLAQDYTFSFSTPKLRPTELRPNYETSLQEEFILKFNQRITPEVAKKISITNSKGDDVKFAARMLSSAEIQKKIDEYRKDNHYSELYLLQGKPADEFLFIKPAALAVGERYSVQFNDSLNTRSFQFSTHAKFAYTSKLTQEITPGEGFYVQFSTRVSRKDLLQHLSSNTKIDSAYLQSNSDTYASSSHYLYLGLKAATTHGFTISKNLTDIFGNKLGDDVKLTVKVGDYPPSAAIPTGYGLIESDNPFLEVHGMNQADADLELASLSQADVMRYEPYGNDEKTYAGLSFKKIPIQFENKKNKLSINKIDLREILEGATSGFVMAQLRTSYYDSYDKRERFYYQRAMLQVSSMAVTLKSSLENTLVFVTRLKDAVPVSGAMVTLYDDNKKELWSGRTDAQGIASASALAKPPAYAFVFNGSEVAYAKSSFNEGIELYRFELSDGYEDYNETSDLRGSIFTERGLYRAGETVYFKGALREFRKNAWQIPNDKNHFLFVKNSRGETIYKRMIAIDNQFGSFSDSVKLAANAPLGSYSISLKDTDDAENYRSIAAESFRVEAYRPATFGVKVIPITKSVVRGDVLQANIEGRYLFGAPMSGDKATWSIQRAPLPNLAFVNYDGYFWQKSAYFERSDDRTTDFNASGSGKLNELGLLTVSQKVDINTSEPSMLTLEAEVTSPSRQALSERTAIRFHPAEFYIGLKPKTTFSEENKTLPVDVVTVNPEGKPRSDKVTVSLVQRQWISAKRAGVGGRYEWFSEKLDTTIFKQEVSTNDKSPTSISVPLKGAGLYFIRAEGKDSKGNVARSDVYVYAYGSGYAAWERRDDDRIDITLDKTLYKPGETASLLVQSPFETSTALLTVEREGVIEHRQFELKGTAAAVQLPVKPEYLPNAFVSIMLFKGRTNAQPTKDSDAGKPSFKIGYVELPVDVEGKRLNVAVKTNKKDYRNGETVEVELLTTDAKGQGVRGEITLAAVDAGVLNLIGYTFPNVFERFYSKRNLRVRTAESLIHLIEQRNYGDKGETRGGDKGGDGTGGFSFRKDFITTPYWNPSIITDANGKAKITFKLPDNLTTFRLMAFAQTTDAMFGKGQTDIMTNQPLTLTAALPRFARIGDKFEAGVVVTNYTDKKANIKITASSSGIKFLGNPTESLSLEAGKSQEVRFKYETEAEGTATFKFAAESDAGNKDGVQLSIPIQTPYTKETLALTGSTQGSQTEIVKIPKAVYPGVGEVSAQVASTALVGLREAVRYVFEYPYGCLEQRSSGILPYIVANDLIQTFQFKTTADTAKGGYVAVVNKTLADFEKYMVPSGGFDYWPQPYRASDYVSVYATYTMLMAEKQSFKVAPSIRNHGVAYLKTILRKSPQGFYGEYHERVTKAFALYVLSLAGEFDNSVAEQLYQQREKLPLDSRAYLMRAMVAGGASPKLAALGGAGGGNKFQPRIDELARQMSNTAKVQNATMHFEDGSKDDWVWTFGSPVKTTALVLQSLTEAGYGKDIADKVVAWLLQAQRNGRWETTQENIFVMDALNTYFRTYENVTPDFKAKMTLAAQTLVEETFKGRSLNAKVFTESLDKFAKGDNLSLTISKEGTGKLFYGVRLSYYPMYALKARDNGISILKTIERTAPDARLKGEFSGGDVVKITLRVAVPDELHFVAVNDPLAAGMEAINPALRRSPPIAAQSDDGEMGSEENDNDYSSTNYSFDFIELRDDRVTLFAERLSPGLHTYTYYARATTYGSFVLPPSYAEEMYSPEVFGRTATERVKILNTGK